ncbi:MAG TPA: glycoside hydrolase family 30 beta sandwich domain-containing protein, partial [Phototrophicaceae bacterium]|nr:glycoside hydrolase family 30 beta sandwich domain-containing protein [Phototrophicaceae bacterium]
FAHACREDLQTLRDAGIPVSMWNMQAEPFTDATYPACPYQPADYQKAFQAVAPVVRNFDPNIQIIADTSMSWDFPFIRPVLSDPQSATLVDALVIHLIGFNSASIRPPAEPSGKPRFSNEFEYLHGPATAARCLNTVQNIMNWFQLADAPTWFWLHALKPYTNEEASGYSLGYWRPLSDADSAHYPPGLEPGHWVWNKYNWYAVGSFVRHMPWDCRSLHVVEVDGSDDDLRICAFERPDGKLTVALSNRSFRPHTFTVDTGRANRIFRGYRYTPESAGDGCQGVPLGEMQGAVLTPELPDMTWECWEER